MFEHNFTVVIFPEDEEYNDDVELTRQFKKENSEWMISDYSGLECEFCESYICDRAQYRDDLDGVIEYVNLLDMKPNQTRYWMYRKFIWEKYGGCGTNKRRQIDDRVQELIVGHSPVEASKRKRGYQSAGNHE